MLEFQNAGGKARLIPEPIGSNVPDDICAHGASSLQNRSTADSVVTIMLRPRSASVSHQPMPSR